jgi:DNA (cytosine-5)-methyltransferase 1
MKHLDLFSGIGGFSLGLEATQRIKTVAFCEIDSFCTKVLNKNWPTVPVYKDIKELTYEKLKSDGIESIDIITGGYPCQPFSIAGSKKGVEDPRHLWPEYFRLIKECRPTWVIGENVSGHIKLGLDAVIEDLESENYSVRTFSVSASSIGAPHQRERVWIVAHTRRGSWGEQFTRNTESTRRGTFETTERSTNTDTSSGPSEGAKTMANTSSIKSHVGENIQHTSTRNGQGQTGRESSSEEPNRNWWNIEPDVGRVADGVPDRTHRLKALGNAVVPQIPYYIAKSILEVMDA